MKAPAVLFCVLGWLAAGVAYAQGWAEAYERGVAALKRGQGPRAVFLFQRAVQARPEPGVLAGPGQRIAYYPYLRLAQAFLLVGDAAAAKQALRRSEQYGVEPAEERRRLAAAAEAMALSGPQRGPGPRGQPPRVAEPEPAPPSTTPTALAATPGAPPATLAPPPATLATPAPALPPTTLAAKSEAAGSLVIYSKPPGSWVYLDDELLGQTDPHSGRLVRSKVPAGRHRLRFARDGHDDTQEEVVVAMGEPTEVRGELRSRPRVLPPVLLLAAVAAAGGLGLLLRAARTRQPRPESDAPPAPGSARVAPPATQSAAPPPPLPASRTPAPARTVVSAVAPPLATPPAAPMNANTLATPNAAVPVTVEEQATRATPAPQSASGEVFGPYRLLEPLGKGGMATVFRAERNGDYVALKRPHSGFLEDAEFLERFQREADIGRSLHHPNIIRIYERGEVGNVPYFTMELIRGETLQAHVRRVRSLPATEAARLIVQVAEALDYAHLKGIVHRDLKPSNIMLVEGGGLKVMDYGIARARRFEGLTVTGAFLGTPDYVAPETAEGEGSDARSDLYSLGVLFYEVITGKRPFVGTTPFETLKKHCSEPPTPPSALMPGCPRELEVIILKLLRKNPADRYPGAEELLIDLRDYLNRAT